MEGKRICDEGGLEAFGDFVGPTERDIREMVSGLSKMTTAQGRINFWTRRVKYNLGIMHWAQGESHCYCMAYLTGISDTEE